MRYRGVRKRRLSCREETEQAQEREEVWEEAEGIVLEPVREGIAYAPLAGQKSLIRQACLALQ